MRAVTHISRILLALLARPALCDLFIREQGSPDNMTPLGIGKSVIQTDCHINRTCLEREGPFWDKKLSYQATVILARVILSGKPCNRNHPQNDS